MTDLTTYNEGSLVGFSAHTDAGREFLSERLDSEPWQWLGQTLWVDHRCASGIVGLALDEGLEFDQGECAKTRDKSKPYEVWRYGGWEWRVLKKWQTPTKEAANPYARWFCFVTSPICPDGEYGDVYVKDITSTARKLDGYTVVTT